LVTRLARKHLAANLCCHGNGAEQLAQQSEGAARGKRDQRARVASIALTA
jgi:hypothetical protein